MCRAFGVWKRIGNRSRNTHTSPGRSFNREIHMKIIESPTRIQAAGNPPKTIDIPMQPIGLAEGALGDAFTVDRRWPIVSGVLREVELPPRSGLVLI